MNKTMFKGRQLRQAMSLLVALMLVGSVSYLGERFYNSSHAATGASMSISPSSQQVSSGSTLSVTIREDSGTDQVNAAQAELTYDGSQVQYVSMSNGDFPLDAADQTSQSGVIRVGRGIQSGTLSGDRAIVTLNFKVLASSGTINLSLNKSGSSVVRSSDNTDILAVVSGGSYTVSSGSGTPAPTSTPAPTQGSGGTSSPTISLLPSSGTLAAGSTVDVVVHVSSASKKITVVEPVIDYPTNQLSFVKVMNSSTFPTALSDKNSGGKLDITRGISGGNSGVTGDNVVATVEFKVIGGSGGIALNLDSSSAAYDDSGTGTNVLSLSGSHGASYSIGSTTNTPAPTPAPTQGSGGGSGGNSGGSGGSSNGGGSKTVSAPSGSSTVYTRSGGIAVSTTGSSGAASQSNTGTQLQGEVDLSPVVDTSQTDTTGTSISKVEYYLGSKLIATKTAAPYTYSFDTKALKNGTYKMTIETYYSNGTVDKNSDNLIVHNPVTLGYIFRHYAGLVIFLIFLILVGGFALFKFVLPHFRGNDPYADSGYDGYTGYASPMVGPSPTAPDPTVVQPNFDGSQVNGSMGPDMSVQNQGSISMTNPVPPQPVQPQDNNPTFHQPPTGQTPPPTFG